MTEGESIGVQIDEESANVLVGGDWTKEQKFKSSEPIFIHGLINEEQRGSLAGHLVIEREVVGDSFEEKERYVTLSSVSVHPHEKWRRKGLGGLMVKELETMARKFGASKIVGQIGAADFKEEPWLPHFYEKLGFTLAKKGEGYSFEKLL